MIIIIIIQILPCNSWCHFDSLPILICIVIQAQVSRVVNHIALKIFNVLQKFSLTPLTYSKFRGGIWWSPG